MLKECCGSARRTRDWFHGIRLAAPFSGTSFPKARRAISAALRPIRRGGLWVGTQEGLYRMTPGGPVLVSDHGLAAVSIRDLHFDPDGTLWIGSRDHGLIRYTGASAFYFDTTRGMADNRVNRVLPSGTNFWFSGNRGIHRVSRQELERVALLEGGKLTLTMFDEKDGLITSQANGGFSPSGTAARDGTLWFPTRRGLAMIDPARLEPNTNPPPVVIQSLAVDEVQLPISPGMEIPPGPRRLEVRYTALSFRSTSKVHFRHKLLGMDKHWVEAGTRRDAAY